MSSDNDNRKFAPLLSDHPLIALGRKCPACMRIFAEGDCTTLVPAYPASEEDLEKARRGRAHNAVAEVFHWDCYEELKHAS
jgi:hypothetical protein